MPHWTFRELVNKAARIGGETLGILLDIEKVNALRGRLIPAEKAKMDLHIYISIYIYIMIYIYIYTMIYIERDIYKESPLRALRHAPRQSALR